MKKERGRTSPFILYPKKNIEEVRECVLENYGQIKYELPFLNALCVEIPEEKIQTIRTNRRIAMMADDIGVSKLTEFPSSKFADMSLQSGLPEATSTMTAKAPHVYGENNTIEETVTERANTGLSTSAVSVEAMRNFISAPPEENQCGAGVAIAIIDTGVAPHYDLMKPFNRILAFRDFVNGKTVPYDDDGHGTHVAGIAAGNAYASKGRYRGTAPLAALVCLKALDQDGNGNASDILAAMQWIYDNHVQYHIRVVNLSLGIDPIDSKLAIDPLELGANALAVQGLTVIAAAGNSGPSGHTITSPGTSPLVLTVGASDNRGHVASFSSRGPTSDGILKPDVVAPGVDIISLSRKNCKGYLIQSGTSMAAPYVSGLAANYYSCYPDATPGEIRYALLHDAIPISREALSAQGHGLLKQQKR